MSVIEADVAAQRDVGARRLVERPWRGPRRAAPVAAAVGSSTLTAPNGCASGWWSMTMTVLAPAHERLARRRDARRWGCRPRRRRRAPRVARRARRGRSPAGTRRSRARLVESASVGTAAMPFSRSASVRPSAEPIASPSGRTCAAHHDRGRAPKRDDGVVVRGVHGTYVLVGSTPAASVATSASTSERGASAARARRRARRNGPQRLVDAHAGVDRLVDVEAQLGRDAPARAPGRAASGCGPWPTRGLRGPRRSDRDPCSRRRAAPSGPG